MVDTAWLRRQVGMVLQENVLFNRSVRDNIALADPAMPMDRIIAASALAGAHEFILELPEGYDTVVGQSPRQVLVTPRWVRVAEMSLLSSDDRGTLPFLSAFAKAD
jgi:ABC-type protease/lipase transport system fused ATPase/permease subunit